MKNLLKEVTFKTLKDLKTYEIVLPGEYSKIFQKNAKDCNLDLDLDNQEILLENLNQDKSRLDLITKETSENLEMLNISTSKAQDAIDKKDTSALKEVQSDIQKMQIKIQTLQNELFTDSLTKSKNRKWFFDHYLKDDKFQNIGYLAFIDLNNFKAINDTYGHIVGDLVLKYLSTYLQKEVKNQNVEVVRYAGDEFMLIFDKNNSSMSLLVKYMDKMQDKLSQQKLKSKSIKSLYFSFSYGLCSFKKNDDFPKIIELADERMYQNKKKVKQKV